MMGPKPISSMRSASSRTKYCNLLSPRYSLSKKSFILPGVPIKTLQPLSEIFLKKCVIISFWKSEKLFHFLFSFKTRERNLRLFFTGAARLRNGAYTCPPTLNAIVSFFFAMTGSGPSAIRMEEVSDKTRDLNNWKFHIFYSNDKILEYLGIFP